MYMYTYHKATGTSLWWTPEEGLYGSTRERLLLLIVARAVTT